MLTNMIEDHITRYRPHLELARDTCIHYAEEIVTQLQGIRDAVEQDDTINVRRPWYLTALAPGAAAAQTIDVPPADIWTLESVAIVGTGAGYVELRDGIGGPLRAGWDVSGANAHINAGGNGVRLQGGSTPVLVATGGTYEVRLQFRIERKPPRHRARAAGTTQGHPSATNGNTRQADELIDRHDTPGIFPGRNVVGDRHRDNAI